MKKNIQLILARKITCEEKVRVEKLLAEYSDAIGKTAIPISNNEICSELLNIANAKRYIRRESAMQLPLIKKYYWLWKFLATLDGIPVNLVQGTPHLESEDYDHGHSFEKKRQLIRRLQIMLLTSKRTNNIDERAIFDAMSELLYNLSAGRNFDKNDAELLNVYSWFITSIHSLENGQNAVNEKRKEWRGKFDSCSKLISEYENVKNFIDTQNLLNSSDYLVGRCYACIEMCNELADYLVQSFFRMHSDIYFTNKDSWIMSLKKLIVDEKIEISEHGELVFK